MAGVRALERASFVLAAGRFHWVQAPGLRFLVWWLMECAVACRRAAFEISELFLGFFLKFALHLNRHVGELKQSEISGLLYSG